MVHLSLVQMAKSFSLSFRIKYRFLYQLMQSVLQRVFHNSVYRMSLIRSVDPPPLEIPQLTAERLIVFESIVNAPQLGQLAAVWTKFATNHRVSTVQTDLANGSFRKASRRRFGAHRVSPNHHDIWGSIPIIAGWASLVTPQDAELRRLAKNSPDRTLSGH
jgi:hypothetical protein